MVSARQVLQDEVAQRPWRLQQRIVPDPVEDGHARRRSLLGHLARQVAELPVLAAHDPVQIPREAGQRVPGARHLGQPQTGETGGQSLRALAQTARALRGQDLGREPALAGEQRQLLPGVDEWRDPLLAQQFDPLPVGGASLFDQDGVGQSGMGGDQGGGAEAPGGGLDQTQRDASAERVADDPVDAVRQLVQQGVDDVAERAARISPVAVSGQVDGEAARIRAETGRPVQRAAGEAVQQQRTGSGAGFGFGVAQSDASATLASCSLSRSMRA